MRNLILNYTLRGSRSTVNLSWLVSLPSARQIHRNRIIAHLVKMPVETNKFCNHSYFLFFSDRDSSAELPGVLAFGSRQAQIAKSNVNVPLIQNAGV